MRKLRQIANAIHPEIAAISATAYVVFACVVNAIIHAYNVSSLDWLGLSLMLSGVLMVTVCPIALSVLQDDRYDDMVQSRIDEIKKNKSKSKKWKYAAVGLGLGFVLGG